MWIHKRHEIATLIARDAIGLARSCGPRVATLWLMRLVPRLRACRREGSLAPVDRAMGPGPFRARLGRATALLHGQDVMGGLREIWVRDVYLGRGFLSIGPHAMVVDLGANMGNFTLLALAHGPGVRAVCVEPIPDNVAKLEASLKLNGWRHRARVFNAFVGGRTATQDRILDHEAPDVPFMREEDLVREAELTRIDLLKCDIEGSEFELFHRGSLLLAMARQIGIEVHKGVAPAETLIELLRETGFEIRVAHDTPGDTVLLGRRRDATISD
jgi:FkbM family methyltransferase